MSNGNVFISGASRGIGNSIAYHFAENDYVVVGTSRNEFEFDKKIKNLIPVKPVSYTHRRCRRSR